MEYYQDPHHRIQADIALRIGKIALQYDVMPRPPQEDFSVTLHLCILQNLLTNCVELFDAMSRPAQRELGLCALHEKDAPWGLAEIKIVRNTFEEKLTAAQILRHIRNAMSHPTGTDLTSPFSSTGYNSIPDGSGSISSIVFSSSPDTKRNRHRTWAKPEQAKAHLARIRGSNEKSFPHIMAEQSADGAYGLFRHGEPFAREFVAILSTTQIRSLVLGLSNLLAQPADEHFDGRSFRQLVA